MSKIYDRFSTVAEGYSKFRPRYPEALYEYILSHCPHRNAAWDAGTGNGQVAGALAEHFSRVYATDISAEQITHALPHPKITYMVCPAEHTELPAGSIDLITVAQAVHWFDLSAFAAEVQRVGISGSPLALWGYGLLSGTTEIDALVLHLYQTILDGNWDPHRKLIEDAYSAIQMPFDGVDCPAFAMERIMRVEDLLCYLRTWSAVERYRRDNEKDPVLEIESALYAAFGGKEVMFTTPIFLRMWRIP